MHVDSSEDRLRTEADEPGWEVDPDDDWGVAVVATVGRQLKLRREAVGMRAADFGVAVGYGEDMVYKIESGKRILQPAYLDSADEVLGAGGLLSAMKEDVRKVRYPKKVRDLAQMEARAVEIGAYVCHSISGLLQTAAHARVAFESRQPPYSEDEVERMVAARLARQSLFQRQPAPSLSFVLEEDPQDCRRTRLRADVVQEQPQQRPRRRLLRRDRHHPRHRPRPRLQERRRSMPPALAGGMDRFRAVRRRLTGGHGRSPRTWRGGVRT